MNTNHLLNYQLYTEREFGFERTPFQSEFERYKFIQSGDLKAVKENIKKVRANFGNGKGVLSEDPIRNIRYHLIISAAVIARICVEGGMPHSESYALSDIYIQKADVCNTETGLLDLIEAMHIDFATRMRDLKKEKVYSIHIRKCIDYIYEHMHEKLTVPILAEYVGRNPSYLSKLFAKETGYNIHDFILNARIDTAKNMLTYSDFSYLDIAVTMGFSSQSAFINTFRKKTGLTPKEYRNKYYQAEL